MTPVQNPGQRGFCKNFPRLSISRSWLRSKYARLTARVFRSEDWENHSPFTICLIKSSNYLHLVNRSKLATASWNSLVVWKYSILVGQRVLDASPSLSATVCAPTAVVCLKWYVFNQCSRSAVVATCSRFWSFCKTVP